MYSAENIQTLDKDLIAFPNPQNIFLPSQNWLTKHFMPLMSINLEKLNSEWQGNILHLLLPFEPVDGMIGDWTQTYHNEFTSTNWFSFRLTEDNHYDFLGNEGYFLRTSFHDWEFDSADEEDFEAMFEGFEKSKENVKLHGTLVNINYPEYEGKLNRYNFLEKLGGEIEGGNWSNRSQDETPPAFTMKVELGENLPNDGITISYQGYPFYHIATTNSYEWCGEGDMTVIMLFEPVNKLILFTFDYS